MIFKIEYSLGNIDIDLFAFLFFIFYFLIETSHRIVISSVVFTKRVFCGTFKEVGAIYHFKFYGRK